MRDRTPTRALENGALRYGVYAEDGSLLRYEYLALEDDPTDPGTELSKATLLQDSTETALFGSAADRTVDEAFAGLAAQIKLIMSNTASITLTLKDSAGHAIPGVLVQGILTESGQAVYSGTDGVAAGYIAEGSQTIKVTGYADIEDYTEAIAVTKGTTITKALTLTTRNFLKITSSRSVKFSGNVSTIDYSVGGAGGGAGGMEGNSDWNTACTGGGGGGGYAVTKTGVEIQPETAYAAVIGAGGTPGKTSYRGQTGYDGKAGGASSFMGTTAAGGSGGTHGEETSGGAGGAGNGKGAKGVYGGGGSDPGEVAGLNGADGTNTYLSSFTTTDIYGGGGGSGAAGGKTVHGGDGGASGGGYGGDNHISSPASRRLGGNGTANTGGGGGSCYGTYGSDLSYFKGGSGGSGVVTIRMHLKSAA